jgi:predicted dehydrogenase
MKQNRRDFMQNTAKGTALTSFAVSVGPISILGANERIRMGGIGAGDRGTDRLRAAQRLGAEIVALCDVNQLMLDHAREVLGGAADRYEVHQDLLERDDIDALVIAPPDHWHHDIFIDAMQAGKDVYQEKPLSHTIEAGARMVEAAEKANRVVQIGNHRRSGKHWHDAYQAIKEGKIGEIKWIRTYDCRDWSKGDPYQARGRNKNLYDPNKINWKRFLGPAPSRPYSSDRASAWRWYWDYAGGLLTDIGAHNIDVAMWMTDCEAPRSVTANGGTYLLDFWETPDVVHTTMDCGTFSIDFSVVFTNGHDGYGHVIYGTKGTIVQENSSVKIFAADNREKPTVEWPMNDEGTAHMQNFLDCVKSRKPTNSPIATAHKVITACHLSNIAFRKETKIKWDAQRQAFI